MTRLFVALIICVVVKCRAETSAEEAETLPNQRYDNDNAETDDTDRSASAQAKAYASVNRVRPVNGNGHLRNYINCFSCVDCPRALPNTTTKYCPYSNDPSKNNKCVVYAERYIQLNKAWYIRGCASEKGSCADIRRSHDNSASVKLLSCSDCEEDRCNTNGVSRSAIDYTIAFLVLVVCPVFGKYTVS